MAKCAGNDDVDRMMQKSKPEVYDISRQLGVLDPVLLPIENKLEDFSTILIDSPGQLGEYEAEVSGKVKSANAILLVYDMTDEQTVESLRSYWLPFIQKWNAKVYDI